VKAEVTKAADTDAEGLGAWHRAGRRLIWLAAWPLRLGPAPVEAPAPKTPFRRLSVVHLLSTGGDAIVTVALAGSVFVSVSLNAARGRTALGLVCTLLPFLVVGPFLGHVIDNAPGGRRVMLSLASLGRAGGCMLMAFWVHSLLFYPAALVTLVCSKAYLVSRAALLPSIVPGPEELVPANAKLAVGSAGSSLVAGVVGAAIYKLAGTGTVLHVDAVLFVVCAVIALGVRSIRTANRPTADTEVPLDRDRNADRDAEEHTIGARRLAPGGVGAVAISMASMRASAGLMTALVVFGFRAERAPLYWYGLVGAASVVGNLGGALLAPLVRERAREEWTVPGCAVVIGAVSVFCLQVEAFDHRLAALVVAGTVTLLAAVAKLSFDSLVQREAPPIHRGRTFARLEAMFQLVWVLAALVPVALAVPLEAGLGAVAGLTLLAVVATLRGQRLARLGRLPAWWTRQYKDGDGSGPGGLATGHGPGGAVA
jgi:Major Facilitator Superfamily